MSQYKLLSQEDRPAFNELMKIERSSKHLIYKIPNNLQLENYYFDDTEDSHKIFAAITDGNLCSCVFSVFSMKSRTWQIRHVVGDSLNSLLSTVNFVISFAESINYYRWNAAYFGRQDLVCERIMRYKVPLFRRYNVGVEEIIPAFRKSSFVNYWSSFQDFEITSSSKIIKEYSLIDCYRDFN